MITRFRSTTRQRPLHVREFYIKIYNSSFAPEYRIGGKGSFAASNKIGSGPIKFRFFPIAKSLT